MNKLDLSGQIIILETFQEILEDVRESLLELNLSRCSIEPNIRSQVLVEISQLKNLRKLDLSESFYQVDNELESFDMNNSDNKLEEILLKGNKLSKFPGYLLKQKQLKVLNLSANEIEDLPEEISHLENLEQLYLGGNKLKRLPSTLGQLKNLLVLYLGGNQLEELPNNLGNLENLKSLSLHENRIQQLPHTFVQLSNLQVLNIHKNQIKVLPVELIGLRHLKQLSVRENPLVSNFASTLKIGGVTSLKELSARAIKKYKIDYSGSNLPNEIISLLTKQAKCCVGCGGAYFVEAGVSQVEFVDLCGAYRVPFLRYICSKNCYLDQSSNTSISPSQQLARVRKVLLDKYNPNLSAPLEILQEEIEQSETSDLF